MIILCFSFILFLFKIKKENMPIKRLANFNYREVQKKHQPRKVV